MINYVKFNSVTLRVKGGVMSYNLKCSSARGGPGHQFIWYDTGGQSGSHLFNKPRGWLTDELMS